MCIQVETFAMIVAQVLALDKRRAATRMQSSSSRTAPPSSMSQLRSRLYLSLNQSLFRNIVIGANQAEGVHCKGSCNIYNVWFEDVCEDAITLRQTSGTTNIVGGGAKNADDKVVQHNGGGKSHIWYLKQTAPYLTFIQGIVKIDSYCVQDFGKLYRSCGNCSTQVKREVQISNIIARNGKLLAGVNSNYGDVATIDTKSNSYTSLTSVRDTFQGNNVSAEPTTLTKNQSNAK